MYQELTSDCNRDQPLFNVIDFSWFCANSSGEKLHTSWEESLSLHMWAMCHSKSNSLLSVKETNYYWQLIVITTITLCLIRHEICKCIFL